MTGSVREGASNTRRSSRRIGKIIVLLSIHAATQQPLSPGKGRVSSFIAFERRSYRRGCLGGFFGLAMQDRDQNGTRGASGDGATPVTTHGGLTVSMIPYRPQAIESYILNVCMLLRCVCVSVRL